MVTRIFLNNSIEEIIYEIKVAKESISQGLIHYSIANTKIDSIKVGDYAYFKTQHHSNKGFYAYGRIIAATREQQLKYRNSNYRNFSETYIDTYRPYGLGNYINFIITYEWYSVVDYNKRLKTKILRKDSNFINKDFNYPFSGCKAEKDVDLLNTYWKKYILEYSCLGQAVDINKVAQQGDYSKLNRKFYPKQITSYSHVREAEPKLANTNIQEFIEANKINISYFNEEEAIEKIERPTKIINQSFNEEDKAIASAQDQLGEQGYFTPKDIKEAEKRITVSIAQRRGQLEF